MIASFVVGQLAVEVHQDRPSLGAAAAARASRAIRTMIERDGKASVVFASAASQNEFLAALRTDRTVDWNRVAVFHLDEYAGLPATHPASFRFYLRQYGYSQFTIRDPDSNLTFGHMYCLTMCISQWISPTMRSSGWISTGELSSRKA